MLHEDLQIGDERWATTMCTDVDLVEMYVHVSQFFNNSYLDS